MSPQAVQTEADNFHDYWIAKPPPDNTRLDWFATWRGWCRRGLKKFATVPPSNAGGIQSDDRAFADALERQRRLDEEDERCRQ